MNEIIIKQNIQDLHVMLDKEKNEKVIESLRKELKLWEKHLADVQRHDLEDKVRLKYLEQNSGV